MSTTIPNILIGLGALIVAGGAYLSQLGWNKSSEVKQRIEMVRNLAETNSANYQTINKAVLAGRIDDQRADPVETEVFTAAIASGLFAGDNHERVRLQLRETKAALQAYNYAASFTTQSGAWSSGPRDLAGNVERGLAETMNLAEILKEPPYSQTGLAEGPQHPPCLRARLATLIIGHSGITARFRVLAYRTGGPPQEASRYARRASG